MGTDIAYYFHIIAWESCCALHRSNIRSHQRHTNTSSQQSDEGGTCYPRLTEKKLKQTFTSLSNPAQENGCRACTKPCRTGDCFNPWPATLPTHLSETTAWIWTVGRMTGNYREGRVWRTTSYQELHFCSVSGFTDFFKLDTCRVLARQFNFKLDLYLSLLLVAHISLQTMSHPLYSNCTVSSSLRMKSMLVRKPQVFGLAVQVELQLDKPSKVCVQTHYSGTNPSAPVYQKRQHRLDINYSKLYHALR